MREVFRRASLNYRFYPTLLYLIETIFSLRFLTNDTLLHLILITYLRVNYIKLLSLFESHCFEETAPFHTFETNNFSILYFIL